MLWRHVGTALAVYISRSETFGGAHDGRRILRVAARRAFYLLMAASPSRRSSRPTPPPDFSSIRASASSIALLHARLTDAHPQRSVAPPSRWSIGGGGGGFGGDSDDDDLFIEEEPPASPPTAPPAAAAKQPWHLQLLSPRSTTAAAKSGKFTAAPSEKPTAALSKSAQASLKPTGQKRASLSERLTTSLRTFSERGTRRPFESRTALLERASVAMARFREALAACDAEAAALSARHASAPAEAREKLSTFRAAGMHALIRPYRFQCQAEHAWRTKRLALLALQRRRLSEAYDEAVSWHEKLSAPAVEGTSSDDGGQLEANASTSAVLLEEDADDYLRSWPDVREEGQSEASLEALRDAAAASHERVVKAKGRVGGKDGRRKALAQLFHKTGSSSSSDAGGEPRSAKRNSPTSSASYFYAAEDPKKRMEICRLLLADGCPERRLVERWIGMVDRTVDETVSRLETAAAAATAVDVTDEDGASSPRSPSSPRSDAVESLSHLVLPFIAHIASKLLDAGKDPNPFDGNSGLKRAIDLPAIAELTNRALLPLVETRLLELASCAHKEQDAQLSAQQRRMRSHSTSKLEVEEYVPSRPDDGLPDLRPVSELLRMLSELSYVASPADYAMRIHALVKKVNEYCVKAAGGGGDGSNAVIGADQLVPMMVLLVVHAELPRGYALLQHVKAYLDPAAIRSEIGYCLCSFEAAVEFVRCCGDE